MSIYFKFSFDQHIRGKNNKAYSMLGIIKKNFKHIDRVAFCIYNAL